MLPGYNVRPLEMSGAIGIEQLKKLPGFISARRENASVFVDLFDNHPYLQIQQEIGESSWFGFAFIIRPESNVSRSDLLSKLTAHGVEVRPIVTGNFVKNEVIKYFDYRVSGKLDAAELIDTHGFFIGNQQIDLREKIKAVRNLLS